MKARSPEWIINVLGSAGFLLLAVGLFALSVPWAFVVLGSVLLVASVIGAVMR